MATYYRWNQSALAYGETLHTQNASSGIKIGNYVYISSENLWDNNIGAYNLEGLTPVRSWTSQSDVGERYVVNNGRNIYLTTSLSAKTSIVRYDAKGSTTLEYYGNSNISVSGLYDIYQRDEVKGSFLGYVYSTSSSAYPTNGISGSYYYDGRTTVTSPTAPSSISYPATITASSVTVSWTAASSLVPSYSVNYYELTYSKNGEPWVTQGGNGPGTSRQFVIPPGTTSIQFRVRARDSNNQWGTYRTGTVSQVVQAPTLTVPEMVMQGQSATVSWSEVDGADSYTLERKSSADADWTQVYAGADTEYTETAGTWTSLQYRVQAVFDGTGGGWATSDSIQIVSASALVISGSDGDLGTLTSDVSYSVSSDQTSPVIDVMVTVNGGEYAAFQAVSGQTYSIGVLDLPTGTGSIVITATTTVSASPVTVTRTWTYTKAAQSFPNAGSVARLTQEGDTIWPQTLAEAVRTTGGPWGGDLSKALNLLMKAATYDKETGDFSDLWGNDIPTVKIETGSYTGTGTYGSSNPNTLNFSFQPKLMFVCRRNADYGTVVPMIRSCSFAMSSDGDSMQSIALVWDTKSVSWYVSNNADRQLNTSGQVYQYIALG